MLRPGHEIETHRRGNLQVTAAQWVRVQERGAFLPVLRRGIALDDIGVRAIAVQQTARASGHRVGQGRMRKGEVIFWKVMILVLRPGAVRLSKGVVGEHLANTGHVALIAIEDFAFGFVLIETERQVIAQIAATLRIPIGQHRKNARVSRAQGHRIDVPRRIVGLVAQERHEIARGSVAHAQHLRVVRRIPEIIDKTWPERCALGQEFYRTRIAIGPAVRWESRCRRPPLSPVPSAWPAPAPG